MFKILVFLDLKALLIVAAVVVLSLAVYRKSAGGAVRLLAIGAFVQTVTLLMGFGWLVNGLAVIDTPETIGPMLAVSILTPFYGSLLNMGIQMYVRFTAVDTAGR